MRRLDAAFHSKACTSFGVTAVTIRRPLSTLKKNPAWLEVYEVLSMKYAVEIEQASISAKNDERWSRGAYAWFRPGEMTAMLPHIANPEGRIHFAGDHTSPSPGWMNGALQSGNRVARGVTQSQR